MQNVTAAVLDALDHGEVLQIPTAPRIVKTRAVPPFTDALFPTSLTPQRSSPERRKSRSQLWKRHLIEGFHNSLSTRLTAFQTASSQALCDELFKLDTTPMELLDPARVVLPTPDSEALDIVSYLTDDLAQYVDASLLFCKEPPSHPVKPFHHVNSPEYEILVRLVHSRGMLELTPEIPHVVNGMFPVPKDEQQRLIYDMRAVNQWTIELPKALLPSPSALGNLPAWVRFFTTCDLSSYYHTLLVPPSWRRYFEFPPVPGAAFGRIDVELLYPLATTVPMGFKGSVSVGQLVHVSVLRPFFPKAARCHGVKFIDLFA